MRRIAAAVVTFALSAAAAALAPVAMADPTTTLTYPSFASATHFSGAAFDACTAPSLSAMAAWKASPYRAVGVYVGGENRSCTQPNLTAAWVASVTATGWRLLPIYLGRQAPCSVRGAATKISTTDAAAQGTAAATDAIASLSVLGMGPGSPAYYDMENYDPGDTACRTVVLTYLSAYTRQLHRRGYLSGVYANLTSGAAQLTGSYMSTAYARPDLLWVARWDDSAALTGFNGVPDSYWASSQRAKQYKGDHNETYGGTGLNIDSDNVDAAIATVARTYTSQGSTRMYTGPTVRSTAKATVPAGTQLSVLCQTSGAGQNGTPIWNKLSNGLYVNDWYVENGSQTGYSPGVARCYYPYQTTVSDFLTRHRSPGISSASVGPIFVGGLVWATCQGAGTKVGSSSVWDKVIGGSWVADYYVANASSSTWSAPVPRC